LIVQEQSPQLHPQEMQLLSLLLDAMSALFLQLPQQQLMLFHAQAVLLVMLMHQTPAIHALAHQRQQL